jgi:hypothetical protein
MQFIGKGDEHELNRCVEQMTGPHEMPKALVPEYETPLQASAQGDE